MRVCPSCHGYMGVSAFRTGTKCVGCTREYNRLYYTRHRQKILAHVKAAREVDVDAARENERARAKRYYEANKPARRESMARWEAKNPGARLARKRFRDAQKLMATPAWVDRVALNQVYAIARLLGDHHVDHIVPLCHPLVCGLHVPWNLQLLSPEENLTKSNKFKEPTP
jgi:5-methylcytosine-specific restriction endonuclease McrA